MANWADHPHTQEGARKKWNNYQGISPLSLPGQAHNERFLFAR